ncbi:hypothetical protein [Aromatoleum toluclasticum]|uniref:hypothetical protein n=1 Tax=Aromatoleum toluclasticum TaxID=92003 RepID=UPI00035FECC2|nr:hypothetical protein [Aromatoleum toluclasticum]
MTITAADIQLLESERMRDTADGGGRQTGNIIPSGLAGNIFPKVSRVDSVYGRVNLRKIYVAVRTATLDMYAGAHAIITDPPNNERISCCLFSTGSAFDQRTEARNRIESYVVAGPLARMRLYGDQLIGQKAISTYQREEESLPDVGDVLLLSVEAAGFAAAEQYVRITDVTHEVRTFTDGIGDYVRRVLSLKIGAPLTQTFKGAEPTRLSTDASPTKVRVTQVADASKYYGIQPLAEQAVAGALSLRLASVYAPLVPSTQRETAVSLAAPAGSSRVARAGAVEVSRSGIAIGTTETAIRIGSPIAPGTVRIENSPGANPSGVDDGLGNIVVPDNAPVQGSTTLGIVGTVNYLTGEILVSTGGAWTAGSAQVLFVPGAEVSGPAHTRRVPISLSNRGAVFSESLIPLPAPGTLVVEYRALGRWYRLRDDGTGLLVANQVSEGTGSVDYVTGAVVVTLGALPDVDSSVVFTWGSTAHYTIRSGATTDAGTALRLEYALAHAPVVPGSLTISYPVGGVSRNATDSGANGAIFGAGVSGTINYATGDVVLDFTALPDRAANLSNAYTWRNGLDLMSGSAATIVAGQFTVPGDAPFRSGGSMLFQASTTRGAISLSGYITSGGQVRVKNGGALLDIWRIAWADQPVGTFNPATGVVTLTGTISVSIAIWSDLVKQWDGTPEQVGISGVSGIEVERDTTSFDPNAVTGEAVAVGTVGLLLDLTNTVADPVLSGSVMFSVAGKIYVDRNGTLYADISTATGSGTAAGSIDYDSGRCTLTFWADNTDLNRSVQSCLTTYGEWTATKAYFRTAGSPIRPASFYVQAATPGGTLISATADQNGVVSGSGITGTVEQTMGVASVDFGQDVMPGSIRYNCVVLANLPLDANILGLDPVRLPSDGRVPIYRPGDVVVIHNTQETALPNPVVAGQTYNVGRTGLATLALKDASGASVASNRYAVDPAAGTVTIAADWTGAGVTQPLSAVHRVEDMSLLADVQINGQIDIGAPLSRTYPAAGTYVSSALLFGDMQALVTNLYDQQTWSGEWSDALIGSQAAAQYDDINYPIEVLNRSAVTERWRINFTSTTAYQVVGENVGVIATGTTLDDCSPINPVTGEAYFVLRAAGWGSGWSAGNQLRFNTVGASGPVWIARTILAGASLAGDSFDIEARGDVD